jgi:hypothetical protein
MLILVDPLQSPISPMLTGQSSYGPITSMSSNFMASTLASTPYHEAKTLTFPDSLYIDPNATAPARLASGPIQDPSPPVRRMITQLDQDLALNARDDAPAQNDLLDLPGVPAREPSPVLIKPEPPQDVDMEVEDAEVENISAQSTQSAGSSPSKSPCDADSREPSRPHTPDPSDPGAGAWNNSGSPLFDPLTQAGSRATSPVAVQSQSLLHGDTPPPNDT